MPPLPNSTLTISWLPPVIPGELGEYFDNDYTRDYLKSEGIEFTSEDALSSKLQDGQLERWTSLDVDTLMDKSLLENYDPLTHTYDSSYARSYKSMDLVLKRTKHLSLEAPIWLRLPSGKLYLFSGNRRTALAHQNKLPVRAWVVTLNRP